MSTIRASKAASRTPALAEPQADRQYDLFETTATPPAQVGRVAARWQEFDDALEEMSTLCMSDRMKRLAIAPVLLDELAFVRDEWRWPSSLDTVDLLEAKSPPTRSELMAS